KQDIRGWAAAHCAAACFACTAKTSFQSIQPGEMRMDPLNPSAAASATPPDSAGETARSGLRPTLLRWFTTDGYGSIIVLALLILVVFPLALDAFRLNLMGKYLTYAFVAVGLVMAWGYGGVLSLGQGVFFGLGGYCMAMFLKLEASDPISTKIQSTPGIPDFMDWNQITPLPLMWEPFRHMWFAVAAVLVVPTALAFVIGFAMFKRRVGG